MNGSRLREEMLDRMVVAYEAVRDNDRLDDRMTFITHHSRLFLRYVIPIWPPKFLIRKIVRALVKPFFVTQADLNEAFRDVLIDMRRRVELQSVAHNEALVMIADLEDQVQTLQAQIARLKQHTAAVPVAGGNAVAVHSEREAPQGAGTAPFK